MLEVTIWDVQHGNATYIKTPSGMHIVQDLGIGAYGTNQADFSPLMHLKSKYRVSRLDYVIITHPHRDHIDDIFNFDKLNPHVLLRPKHLTEQEIRQGNQRGDDKHIEKYLEINARYSNPVDSTEDPKQPSNNGGVAFQTFIPTSCARSNLNNHSVVTVINYATSTILLPGDNESVSWKELLEREDFCKAIRGTDILLAPHHGRQSAFCRELFDHFTPKLTIISDGPCDSSAVSEYGGATSGWTVNKRSGGQEQRKCVTTRRDGVINVKLGYNSNNQPYLAVYIN